MAEHGFGAPIVWTPVEVPFFGRSNCINIFFIDFQSVAAGVNVEKTETVTMGLLENWKLSADSGNPLLQY